MMYVVMTGTAGDVGAEKLYNEHRTELEAKYSPSYCRRFLSLSEEISETIPEGLISVPMTSGVYNALWKIGEMADCGFEIIHCEIPIKQETIEICETLGENPYEQASCGSLYLTDEPTFGRVIGHTTDSAAKTVMMKSGIRYLNRPQTD